MCLNLIDSNQQSKIAESDIVCYKVLVNKKLLIKEFKKSHGKDCVAIMGRQSSKVFGKLSIESNEVYICHNNPNFIGFSALNKFGFDYSWLLNSSVSSIIVDEQEILEDYLVTPFQGIPITIGESYKSELCKFTNVIEEGLHSLKFLDDIPEIFDDYYSDYTIVKCIIPAGSEYFEGEFKEKPSYASNAITYLESI